MNPDVDPKKTALRTPPTAPPRKRFRIEKLEERVAPTKGGKGTHHCSGGGGTSSITVSSGSIY